MDWAQRFGELRSLAQQPPSYDAWDALRTLSVELTDSSTSSEEERRCWHDEAIPYLLGALRHWPRHLRCAPWWDTRALL
jgi:hypothetical protein